MMETRSRMSFRCAAPAAFLSGWALALCFPHPGWWFLSPVVLVPWLLGLRNQGSGIRFLLGAAFGLGYHLWLIWWVMYPHPVAYPLLCLYAVLVYGLAGLAVGKLDTPLKTVLWFPAVFAGLEFVRGLSEFSFGWGLLGHTTWKVLPLAQWAEYGGVAFLTFLLAGANGAFSILPEIGRFGRRGWGYAMVPLAMLVLMTALGNVPLAKWRGMENPKIRVGLVQPGLEQEEKWDRDYLRDSILPRTFEPVLKAAGEKPDLIVLPETAIPANIDSPYAPWLAETVAEHIRTGGVPVLVGYVRDIGYLGTYEPQNSVALWPPGARSLEGLQHYEKTHLVPWGEYVPFSSVFPFIERLVTDAGGGVITAGTESVVIQLGPDGPGFGVPICFESSMPGLVSGFVRSGADFLVNVTNDAWFRRSGAQDQHRIQSVFRAIENRRSVVRSANTGRTCSILPTGEVSAEIPLYESGALVAEVPLVNKVTFFTRFGDVFGWLCLACVMVGYGAAFLRKRISSREKAEA